jgi:hypothetical protein
MSTRTSTDSQDDMPNAVRYLLTYKMIPQVFDDMQAFDATEFGKFDVQVFKEDEKIFIRLILVDQRRRVANGHSSGFILLLLNLGKAYRMTVQVLNEDRRRKGWSMMQARATVRVTACSNLEVERTIDLVFFRPVNTRQVFCHAGLVPLQVMMLQVQVLVSSALVEL